VPRDAASTNKTVGSSVCADITLERTVDFIFLVEHPLGYEGTKERLRMAG